MNARRLPWRSVGRWVGLGLYLAFALAPLYWLLKIAITPTRLLYSDGVRLWPGEVTLAHFSSVWTATPYPDWFWNSTRVALGAAVLATLAGALAGYALSRWVFRGKRVVAFTLLVTQMFTVLLFIVPLNRLLSGLGLNDALWGLVAVYAALNVPFAAFLMQGFIDTIPRELEDAALTDGATRWQAFSRVVAPLALPGLSATAGFVFTAAWSELFVAWLISIASN